MINQASVFQRAALASGLVTEEEIVQAVAELRPDPDGPPVALDGVEDQPLAEKLVELGQVTTYQADQLLAGRSRLTLGPYIITDWIGQGGMGQVFKAEHNMMGREVAVKVLPLSRSTPEAIEHFTREIRLQAQLDHPNLVRAFDAGHDGNVHYLVTEYVPGTDLRRLVRTSGKLSMPQAAHIIAQAASGLSYAHQRGMLHRDVKPGNILVAPDGTTKVSDLGLAGFVADGDRDPRAGKIVGTADYLSPDQIKNPRSITQTSDIYSLGCTLYYAVTGKVPFPGGTTRDKARRHCEETPWHPHRFNPDLGEDFIEVIADMMEKEPGERIQSMAEVAARLEPWARERSPLPADGSRKSPWTLPPAPPVLNEEHELHDTDAGSGAIEESDSAQPSSQTGASQTLQGTAPLVASNEDTRRSGARHRPPVPITQPVPPPPPSSASSWMNSPVALALAIAIPASMLVGALLMFFAMWLVSG